MVTPYPRHRHAIAALLQQTESYLWPNALPPERVTRVAQSEVVRIYPRRSAVPTEVWQQLLEQAQDRIGILVYAGLFLPEQLPRLIPALKAKAEAGTRIEILLGDPN
ncbi:MAG TPA: hypothetical protein VNV66_01550 [Pilimelia sp.]|nr:hypothetical protein [Pilimelia sp.]